MSLLCLFRPASKSWKKNWNKKEMHDPRYDKHLDLMIAYAPLGRRAKKTYNQLLILAILKVDRRTLLER